MRILLPSLSLADPHLCTDNKARLSLHGALFDALVRRDAAGRFVPALASAWAVAPDARTWTFRLTDGVRFHGGERLEAADVAASLARACDPSVGGELGTEGVWASYLGDVGIEVRGSLEIRLVTGVPMADLLELLVDIPILPRSAPGAGGAGVPPLAGTGPYALVERSDEVVVMEARRGGLREPREARLEWRAEPAAPARATALLAGKAHVATALAASDSARLREAGGDVLAHRENLCVAFLFNLLRGAGTDRRVRQAVNHAVDVRRMIAVAAGGAATALNGPLSPLHFGCDPGLAAYRHDPDRARALLEASGAGAALVVDVPTSLPDEAPVLGQLMAEDLAAVGLEVELRTFEDRVAYAYRVKDKAIDDLCCFDSSPLSTYRVMREKLDSRAAGPWWQGYHRPEVNEALDRAAATVDDAERQQIYRRAYRMVHDDAPWLFLYRPTHHVGAAAGTPLPEVGPEGWLRVG